MRLLWLRARRACWWLATVARSIALFPDFVSGAAEKLVLAHQHHDVIVVVRTGQSVSSSLLVRHAMVCCMGLMPDGLILCYTMGRQKTFGMETVPLASLERVIEFYGVGGGDHASVPCDSAVAVNGREYSDEAVAAECQKVSGRLGLPACDVLRHGPERLVGGRRAIAGGVGERVAAHRYVLKWVGFWPSDGCHFLLIALFFAQWSSSIIRYYEHYEQNEC